MDIESIRGFSVARQSGVVDLNDPLFEARKTRHVRNS